MTSKLRNILSCSALKESDVVDPSEDNSICEKKRSKFNKFCF